MANGTVTFKIGETEKILKMVFFEVKVNKIIVGIMQNGKKRTRRQSF